MVSVSLGTYYWLLTQTKTLTQEDRPDIFSRQTNWFMVISPFLYPRKRTNKCSFERFLLFERFFSTFLHFVHLEAKIVNVFSREISVNTQQTSINARLSRNKCVFSIVHMSIKSQNERKSRRKLLLAEKSAKWRSRLFPIWVNVHITVS
jgi:hypothetical protein